MPRAEIERLGALVRAGLHRELEIKAGELLLRYPNAGLVWKMLGVSLWMQGKDALPALQRVTHLLPQDAEAHCNLGIALRAANRLDGAVLSHQRAIELKADYAEAHNNLGSALLDLGRLDEALAHFRRAVAIRPVFALAHHNLANALMLQNRLSEAERSCRRALEINPRLTPAIIQLAEMQAAKGQFAQAEASMRSALELDPKCAEALAGLVRFRKMGCEDGSWLERAQALAQGGLGSRQEVYLRYAMGKYFDDVRQPEQAFEQYARANELCKHHRAAHDREKLEQGIDRIIETFDARWLSTLEGVGHGSDRPVLIVGMPRSGTTLVEQILAAHPLVYGAGELSYWGEAASGYVAHVPGEAEALRGLGQGYLDTLKALSSDARRVVDKMPGNFLYLALILAALPNARIIHMRRHPIDTCLSIYFQNLGAMHSYANDLEDLEHYYRQYVRLMEHWRGVLPGQAMLEVRYEDLVQDPEGWSRRMVEHAGLDWDERCLEFHLSSRPVSTFSKWQARQKISSSSVERWRKYEKFLTPLLTLLDEQPAA